MKTIFFIVNCFLLINIHLLDAETFSKVMVINVQGSINPTTAEFIEKSIKKANKQMMEAIIIQLDTPGGLDKSMRQIVKDINNSKVPIVVYVSPSGARATSAGVFITMAAHIAAMAEGTNIGAAHPVMPGGKMDKIMTQKITNDAVAYIKAIAESRGRNISWAEKAVRKSVSVSAKEALKLGVIDILTNSIEELLEKIDGKIVKTAFGIKKKLKTKNALIVKEEMGIRLKILKILSDPNIAYILLLLGFYGLFFELTNPGAVFPGVVGAISLILAFYSFQTLPVNYAGLLLIILAIVMFILEVKITSYGILSIGGIISMVIGSLMLFETPFPFMRLSFYIIIPAVIITVLFFTITFGLVFKAYRRKPITGVEGLIGLEGIAYTDIYDEGMVFIRGEYWQAFSEEYIKKGEKIKVVSVSGLKIRVKRR